MRRPRYVVGALGGVALIGSAIGGLHALQSGGEQARASVNGSFPASCSTLAATTTCAGSGPASAADAPASPYRDGDYTVTGHYETPGGSETLGVSLTVRAGVVSDAAVRVEAISPTARQFQDQFASRYAGQVVARDLATVAVSRVAGASLTSVGFNRALAEIRVEAHA